MRIIEAPISQMRKPPMPSTPIHTPLTRSGQNDQDLFNSIFSGRTGQSVKKPTPPPPPARKAAISRRIAQPQPRISAPEPAPRPAVVPTKGGQIAKPVAAVPKPIAAPVAGPVVAPTPPKTAAPEPVGFNTNTPQPIAAPDPGAINAPDIDSYLGQDTSYQNELAGYGKSLSDLLAEQTGQRNQKQSYYANLKRQLADARTAGETGIAEDFASRGMANSGAYAQAVADFNAQQDAQASDYDTQYNDFDQSLNNDYTNFQSQLDLQKANAYQQAIQRRAEKYNLGLG